MDQSTSDFLCMARTAALVLIALWLWMYAGKGYASDFGTLPQPFDGTAAWGSAAGSYHVLNDQVLLEKNRGGFSNRYEPPMFWNIGNARDTSEFYQHQASLGVILDDPAPAPAPAPVPTATEEPINDPVGTFRGYNTGVKLARKGRATNKLNVISPY